MILRTAYGVIVKLSRWRVFVFAATVLVLLLFSRGCECHKESALEHLYRLTASVKLPLIAVSRKDLLRQCYGKYGCFSVDYPWFSTRRYHIKATWPFLLTSF